MDPGRAPLTRDLVTPTALEAKAMPPLWQYFSPLRKKNGDEPVPAPWGETRGVRLFLQIQHFSGCAMGAMTSMMAPPVLPRLGWRRWCENLC
jgi:hypothetical protein